MALLLTKKKIDLEEETVDIKIDIIEMDSPLEDIDYHLLRALYHLGKKFRSSDGFWIQAKYVVEWLKANNFEMTTIDVGKRMKSLGFGITKRLSDGIFRWVNREKLQKLITTYNEEGMSMDEKTSCYEDIKQAVFDCMLNGGDVSELKYDIKQIQVAVKEFMAMETEEAEKWLKRK